MADGYIVFSAAVPTTAVMVPCALVAVTIKTLVRLTVNSGKRLTVVGWGIDFDGTPSAVQVELIHTTTVAPTDTAVTPTPLTDGAAACLATAGFNASAEGTVAGTPRVLDSKILSGNSFAWEFSDGREPIVPVSGVLRIRAKSPTALNALAWIKFEE